MIRMNTVVILSEVVHKYCSNIDLKIVLISLLLWPGLYLVQLMMMLLIRENGSRFVMEIWLVENVLLRQYKGWLFRIVVFHWSLLRRVSSMRQVMGEKKINVTCYVTI